jgi:E3 ubiquitin-protein ligase TRIP12
LKKEQSEAETLETAVDARATASDPELDDMDEEDEELVDEMDSMEEEEPENSVSVEVPTPTPGQSGTPGFATRLSSAAMSYAAALQQVPQDWHLEFEFGGHTIPLDSTVFEPLHRYSGLQTAVNGYYHIFSGMHTLKFRKVPGPPPSQGLSRQNQTESDSLNSGMDDSLIIENPVSSGADTTASILKLLKLLHSLCVRWDEILEDTQTVERLRKPDLVSQFVNTKLTAKLNRQLEEPLLIASNCLPTWAQDLARHYPFLFPFETRYLFVQSTSFGYSRCMNRWVPQRSNNSRSDRRELPLGRQQRSKLKLQSRENFLRLALTAMYKYAHKPPVLEMEYEDEVGTGLGPTLEFYANTSKEFARRKLHMWRENDAVDGDEFLHVHNGLFPAPIPDGKSNDEEYIPLQRG